MLESYKKYLFYIYIPINIILWIYLVTGKPFIIGAQGLILVSVFIYMFFFSKKINIDKNYSLVFLFVIYCFTLTTLHFITGDLIDSYGRSLAEYHYYLYPLYIIAYIYGRNSKFEINWVSYATLAITFLLITTIANLKTFTINYDVIDSDKSGVYLALSDLFLIYLVFFISYAKNNYYRFLLFMAGCLGLIILNSRSSLYAFVIIFVIYQALYNSFRIRIVSFFTLILILFVLLGSSYFASLLESNSRMFAIFTGINDDSSKVARDYLFETGLKRTLESPVLGDYGGVIREHNNIGSYIHNIFSYWQTFGLLPFIVSIVFFIVVPLITAYKAYKDRYIFNSAIYFNLSLYIVIAVLLTKPYGWYNAWFLLGFLHTYSEQLSKSYSTVSKYK